MRLKATCIQPGSAVICAPGCLLELLHFRHQSPRRDASGRRVDESTCRRPAMERISTRERASMPTWMHKGRTQPLVFCNQRASSRQARGRYAASVLRYGCARCPPCVSKADLLVQDPLSKQEHVRLLAASGRIVSSLHNKIRDSPQVCGSSLRTASRQFVLGALASSIAELVLHHAYSSRSTSCDAFGSAQYRQALYGTGCGVDEDYPNSWDALGRLPVSDPGISVSCDRPSRTDAFLAVHSMLCLWLGSL